MASARLDGNVSTTEGAATRASQTGCNEAAQPRRGLVKALGADAEQAARIYAELTSRAVGATCLNSEEIHPGPSGVVVTTSDRLTADLLDTLYPRGGEDSSAPGIIFADTEDALIPRVQAVARAFLDDRRTGPPVELYAGSPLTDEIVGGRRVMGGGAPARAIREAVMSRSPLLSSITHSNGFDLYLDDRLTLCDATVARGRTLVGAPVCRVTGECYRHRAPIAQAVEMGRLLSPHEIRARILFLCVCVGIVTADESRKWNYSGELLAGGDVAAVITTWSIVLSRSDEIALVLGRLYRGEPAGRAVAALNRCRGNRHTRVALLGDPDARIEPLAPGAFTTLPLHEPVVAVLGDGGRFLHALTMGIALHGSGEVRDLAAAAAAAVRRCEHLAAIGEPAASGSETARAMREAVVTYAGHVGGLRLLDHWTPLAYDARWVGESPCAACSGPSELLRFRFRAPGLAERDLVICPRCGLRRDGAIASELNLTRSGRTLTLHGRLPACDWAGMLHMGCDDASRSTSMPWPASARGEPARTFAPPGRWPPGTLSVSVIMVWNYELTVVSTPAPAEQPVS